jgi:hypothetical protein
MLPTWMGGAPETKAAVLLRRIRTSEIVDDRRRAVEELHDLTAVDLSSHDEVGRDGMAVLVAVLRADAEHDPDIARNCLEALVNISTMQRGRAADDDEVPVGTANGTRFVAVAGAVDLLLDLLAQHDFYVRFATCQLLTALFINQPQAIQDAFKSKTEGVGRLMDAMADSRHKAMIAKEALLLMVQLTQTSVEIKMAVVFDGAFDRTFEIVSRTFEDDYDGGVVVKDCLDLLHNLLRDNPPNQTYFRENGDILRLAKMLQLEPVRSARATSAAALLQNVDLMVEVVQTLVSGTIAGTLALVQNQTKLGMDGVLVAMLDVATSEGQSTAIRTSALHCVERMVVDHATNSKLLTDYCRKRSLTLKLHRTMAISIAPARPDGADTLSDSIANAAAGGVEAMMESVSAEGGEHAALRLAESDAKLDAEKERVQNLQAELSVERAAYEEERAKATANAQELERHAEALASELGSLRRLSEARAASSSDVLELERRVAELTAELAASQDGRPPQSQDGVEAPAPPPPPPPPPTQPSETSPLEQNEHAAQVQALQDAHEAQRAELQAQLDAARADHETVSAQMQSHAAALTDERALASTNVLELEQRVSELTSKLSADSEQTAAAVSGEQAEYAAKLQAVQDEHAAHRSEHEDELAALRTQLDATRVQNDTLQAQVQSHAAALTDERASASTNVLELEHRLAEVTAELTDARLSVPSTLVPAGDMPAVGGGDSVFAACEKILTPTPLRDGSALFDTPAAVQNDYVPGNRFDEAISSFLSSEQEKAAEVAQLQEELKAQTQALEAQVYAHASELSEERASASAKVLELEQRVSELVSAREGEAGTEEEHTARLQALEASHAARQAELEAEMETARAEAMSLQTQVDSHASELSEERASASAKVLELEQRVSELNKQLFGAREQVDESVRESEEQASALADEVVRSDALAEQLKKVLGHESESSEAIAQYQAQTKEAEASLARARTENVSLQSQIERHESELAEAKKQLTIVSDLQRVHLELEGTSGELEEQVFLLKAELGAVKQAAAQQANEHGSIQETLRTAGLVAAERLQTEMLAERETYEAELQDAEEQRRTEAANLAADLEMSQEEVRTLEAELKVAGKAVERDTAELQQRVQELTRQLAAATEEVAMTRADAEKEIAQLAKDETDILIWCVRSICQTPSTTT